MKRRWSDIRHADGGRPLATSPQQNIARIKTRVESMARVSHRPPTGALLFLGDRAPGRPVENAPCSGDVSVASARLRGRHPPQPNIAQINPEPDLRAAASSSIEHRPFQSPVGQRSVCASRRLRGCAFGGDRSR